jgi:hypothetical protein
MTNETSTTVKNFIKTLQENVSSASTENIERMLKRHMPVDVVFVFNKFHTCVTPHPLCSYESPTMRDRCMARIDRVVVVWWSIKCCNSSEPKPARCTTHSGAVLSSKVAVGSAPHSMSSIATAKSNHPQRMFAQETRRLCPWSSTSFGSPPTRSSSRTLT